MDENLRQSIIQELSLTNMSEDEANTIITAIGGAIMREVFIKIAEGLPDDTLEVFDGLLSLPNGEEKEEKLAVFFGEYVHELDEIVVVSSKKVIEEYKSYAH